MICQILGQLPGLWQAVHPPQAPPLSQASPSAQAVLSVQAVVPGVNYRQASYSITTCVRLPSYFGHGCGLHDFIPNSLFIYNIGQGDLICLHFTCTSQRRLGSYIRNFSLECGGQERSLPDVACSAGSVLCMDNCNGIAGYCKLPEAHCRHDSGCAQGDKQYSWKNARCETSKSLCVE